MFDYNGVHEVMPPTDLHNYIALLESSGELSRIDAVVDPVLEIAAITDRVGKSPHGGRALLFENPAGSDFKVATNLFGSGGRVCQALGIDHPDRLTERMNTLLEQIPDISPDRLDQQISALHAFSGFTPLTATAPDPDLITMKTPDLTIFPFLQNWPEDGLASGHGRYITLPQVFTVAPDGSSRNCGLYRSQLCGPQGLAIQWKNGSGASRHFELYKKRRELMPVAIILGGDPALLFTAMLPLPGELDEVTFAGFLRGHPLHVSPSRTLPLSLPTGAEIVIEGYIDPAESVTEGPFGNHTGSYSPAAPAPLLRVTAIHHRHDAIVPATVVGPPPMEDCYMAKVWERLLLAFIKRLVPSVTDIHFPFEWIFHQSAIISLENPAPGMVSDISGQLWALPWFASSRVLIFVDAEPESPGLSHAAWRYINLVNYSDDIIRDRISQRIAVDATGCGSAQTPVKMPDEVVRRVDQRWREYGL